MSTPLNSKRSVRVSAAIALTCLVSACAGKLNPNSVFSSAPPAERPSSDKPSLTDLRNKSRAHVELGTAYLEGSLGTALDEARIAVAYDRTYAPAHLLMGQVYALLEQYPQAQAAFEEAASLAPGDPEVNNAYGWFLCNQNRQKEGASRLEQAARNPYYTTPARAWTNLGVCNFIAKDGAAAEVAFMRAYQADPDNLRAKYHLALIAYGDGRLTRAREFATDINRQPERQTAETLWLALRIERKLGSRDGEQSYGRQLARNFPASIENQSYKQGKFE